MRRRALLFGSNGPNHSKRLKYAESDVKRLHECLSSDKCGFDITLPTSKFKNIYNVMEFIDLFLIESESEDCLILYFSGHGELINGDLHLLLEFTDINYTTFTSVPIEFLRHGLRHCQARNKLVILDCCYAGAIYHAAGMKGKAEVKDVDIIVGDAAENLIALVASGRFQRAREDKVLGSGVLTYFLINTIENHKSSRQLSIQDLSISIQRQIIEENGRRPGKPKLPLPRLQGDQQGLFYVTVSDAEWQWPVSSGVPQLRREHAGRGCNIALLDTGCDHLHPQLQQQRFIVRSFSDSRNADENERGVSFSDSPNGDENGHGTSCGSILVGDDIGIAPAAELIPVDVLGPRGAGAGSNILLGFEHVLKEAKHLRSRGKDLPIALLAAGMIDVDNGLTKKSFEVAVDRLLENDILLIAAAGNDSMREKALVHGVRIPAVCKGALAVGAVDFGGLICSFSNHGETEGLVKPEIFGYGHKVLVALPHRENTKRKFDKKSGTSMAAAYVAGIAALYHSVYRLSGQALKDRLIETALPIPSDPYGRGIARFLHA